MDGGNSLNLIYANTLRKIKIPMNDLLPPETSFHRIVPGKPAYPLRVIHLDVIFGTPANFRKEKIEFEVVDWPSQYHAILGRPAFARLCLPQAADAHKQRTIDDQRKFCPLRKLRQGF
jgi:hypothetical protein